MLLDRGFYRVLIIVHLYKQSRHVDSLLVDLIKVSRKVEEVRNEKNNHRIYKIMKHHQSYEVNSQNVPDTHYVV